MPPQFKSQFDPANKVPTPANNPVNPVQPKSPRRYGFLLTLTFLLVLTGIFGVWYFSNPLPEEESESLISADQFADWKTYRNEEYGFEIMKLPECDVLEQKEYSAVAFKCSESEIRPYSPRILFLKDVKEEPPEDALAKKEVIVNGIEGVDIIIQGHGKFFDRYLYRGNDTFIITISLRDEDLFDSNPNLPPVSYLSVQDEEILSTFKFISTSTSEIIDTSNWKTYKNTKYGFEFKYPDNVGILNEMTSEYAGPPTDPQEVLLLIADKEKTFHFQINDGILYIFKESPLGKAVLSTLKFTK